MNTHGLKLMIERLKLLLPNDTGLDNWAQTHFGQGLTAIVGNRPMEQVFDNELPAVFIVTGEATNEIEVSNYLQRPDVVVPFGFVWHEQDPEKAVWQSAELADLLIQFVMRYPELADEAQGHDEACAAAFIRGYNTDRGGPTIHPRHQLDVELAAQYEVYHP